MIGTKECSKCHITKPIDKFHFRKDTNKYRHKCKMCVSEYDRQYRIKNKLMLREKQKLWCKNNPNRVSKYKQDWKNQNKDRIAEQNKKYREENLHKIKKYRAKWNKNNPGYYAKYVKRRKANDIHFRLTTALRSRLSCSVRNNYKCGSAVSDMGCSIHELRNYLENRFLPGMTWENYGKWHIDHILPLSLFNLQDRKQFLKACHYTNLQPLWAADNLKKGNKTNV